MQHMIRTTSVSYLAPRSTCSYGRLTGRTQDSPTTWSEHQDCKQGLPSFDRGRALFPRTSGVRQDWGQSNFLKTERSILNNECDMLSKRVRLVDYREAYFRIM